MFPLNRVMAGWRECVMLMTIGETRRCWVPQELAYNGRAGRPTGHRRLRHRADRLPRRRRLIPPPDVKAPPEDAKRTASGLAYKVLRAGQGHAQPEPVLAGERALHRLDDRREDVRQLGPARHADDDAARRSDHGLERRRAD